MSFKYDVITTQDSPPFVTHLPGCLRSQLGDLGILINRMQVASFSSCVTASTPEAEVDNVIAYHKDFARNDGQQWMWVTIEMHAGCYGSIRCRSVRYSPHLISAFQGSNAEAEIMCFLAQCAVNIIEVAVDIFGVCGV